MSAACWSCSISSPETGSESHDPASPSIQFSPALTRHFVPCSTPLQTGPGAVQEVPGRRRSAVPHSRLERDQRADAAGRRLLLPVSPRLPHRGAGPPGTTHTLRISNLCFEHFGFFFARRVSISSRKSHPSCQAPCEKNVSCREIRKRLAPADAWGPEKRQEEEVQEVTVSQANAKKH